MPMPAGRLRHCTPSAALTDWSPPLAARREVLEHLPAGLFALATLVGALLHGRVIGVPIAHFRAALAHVRTRGADRIRVRPDSRRNARGRVANRGTVLTRLQRGQVVFLAIGD